MADTVQHLALHKETDHLGGLVDPCSKCEDKPDCTTTCQIADTWWRQLALKLNGGK